MAKVTIVDVSDVSADSIALFVETDILVGEGKSPVVCTFGVSRLLYAVWQDENPEKSFEDYVAEQVKELYAKLRANAELAKPLKGKKFEW